MRESATIVPDANLLDPTRKRLICAGGHDRESLAEAIIARMRRFVPLSCHREERSVTSSAAWMPIESTLRLFLATHRCGLLIAALVAAGLWCAVIVGLHCSATNVACGVRFHKDPQNWGSHGDRWHLLACGTRWPCDQRKHGGSRDLSDDLTIRLASR